MEAATCSIHGTPTVAESTIVESETTTLDEGLTLAGRYRIGKLLGQGGMGAVYEAHEERMGRKVALKILTRSRLQDPVHLRRFYREARAAGSLDHPSIVRVYDFGVDDDTGFPFIAMECIDGLPLQRLLEETGPLPEARAAHLVLQVAQALTEAHDKGIVHRDLKPENLMVRKLSDGTQQVKVLDFGVAKIRSLDDQDLQTLTAEGVPIGTPLYMSPEQARGVDTDFRSDLYALGFILYRLLTGQPAMADDNPLGTLIRHVVEEEPRLPKVLSDANPPSAALVTLYHDLVAKEPARRPSSTTDVVERLQNIIRIAEASTLDETNPPAPLPSVAGLAATWSGSKPPLASAPEAREELGTMGTAPLPIFDTQPVQPSTPTSPSAPVYADASGASASATKSRIHLWVPALLAAFFVVWTLWLQRSDVPSSAGAERVTPATPAKSKEAEKEVPQPRPKAVAVTPAPVRTIKITSGPSGAAVYRGAVYLGETPLDYAVEATGEPIDLRFAMDGYPSERRRVGDGALLHVAFRRAASAVQPEGKPARKPVRKAPKPPEGQVTPGPVPDAPRTLPTW